MANVWDLQGNNMNPAPQLGSPWTQPGGNYGQTQDWYNTPIGQGIREDNMPLAFAAYREGLGIPNNDNTFNRWFQSQLPRFQEARGMAAMYNPLMTVDQFMQTLPGYQQMRNEFNALSPNARNAQYSQFVPNSRWVRR